MAGADSSANYGLPSAASGSSAFETPGGGTRPGWPNSTLECNLPLRLTGGLAQAYAAVNRSRSGAAVGAAAAGGAAPGWGGGRAHVTYPDGSLALAPDMPLLAKRYRYLNTLSASELSQIVSASDTYRSCAPVADGRRQPLVAIKVLNAQHWVLGAQEYERMRRLRLAQVSSYGRSRVPFELRAG
jgi:hypothetical protein